MPQIQFNLCHISSLKQVLLTLTIIVSFIHPATASTNEDKHKGDEHYNEAVFFDMHVCNWPKRPLFFTALFSTTQFNNIKKIEIFDNNNKHLDNLNLAKYRLVMLKNLKEKKEFF